jgi:hypothetical protein
MSRGGRGGLRGPVVDDSGTGSRFVDLAELTEFRGAADLYVTPYLNETQIEGRQGADRTPASHRGDRRAVLGNPSSTAASCRAQRAGGRCCTWSQDHTQIVGRSDALDLGARTRQ